MIYPLIGLILLASAPSSTPREFLTSPQFFALYESLSERVNSPDCALERYTRQQNVERLRASPAYQNYLNSPEYRRWSDASKITADACADDLSFIAEDGPCKDAWTEETRAREAMAASCVSRTMQREPARRALEESFLKAPECRDADRMVNGVVYMAQPAGVPFGAIGGVPWSSLNEDFKQVWQTSQRAALRQSSAYITLLVTARAVRDTCMRHQDSSATECQTWRNTLERQASDVSNTAEWQRFVAQPEFQAIAEKLAALEQGCN